MVVIVRVMHKIHGLLREGSIRCALASIVGAAFLPLLAACPPPEPQNADSGHHSAYIDAMRERSSCQRDCWKTKDDDVKSCIDRNLADAQYDTCVARADEDRKSCDTGCKCTFDVAVDIDHGNCDGGGGGGHEGGDPQPDYDPTEPPRGGRPHARPAGFAVSQFQCADERQGLPVQVIYHVAGIGYTGLTTPVGNGFLIRFRPDFDSYSPTVQRFIFAHECGHVNSRDFGVSAEVTASCWAASRLTQENAMSMSDWEEVHQMLVLNYPQPTPSQTNPGTIYPSGEQQYQSLMRCRSR